jgi:guanine nucleotide exchange factor VAV
MASDPSLKVCVDWLVRCSLLPRDHWLASGNAQMSDLAHQLKDGVLLCHLLNRIFPTAIDPKDFSQRPQMSQFLCLKNSRAFVQACKTVFKIRDDDLFDPHNLYNPASCGKVLHTLSVLSKTPLALKTGVTSFNLTDTYYTNMKAFDKVLDDYVAEDGLENEVGVSDSDEEGDDAVYENHTNPEPDPDKSIYDDLCSIRQYRSEQQDTQPKTKRDMCIQELVETEKKYVDVLTTIRTGFMKPLRELRQLVPPSDFETIFMGIEKLWAIHTDFKADLMKACEKNTTKSIPDCFVTCKEKFLFYGEYCSNLTLAQETMDKLCQNNSSMQAKVQELELVANEGRFRIRDMLSIPMQRVLKYHLLLKV